MVIFEGDTFMSKLNLNRVPMPRQDPEVRGKNFKEVSLGYTAEAAREEANRCIQCPKRPCTEGCPVGVDIPEFIKALRDDNLPEAAKILKGKNSLPGICGRSVPRKRNAKASAPWERRERPSPLDAWSDMWLTGREASVGPPGHRVRLT
jgi:glutamate synthase (NADPH/NADH) small chain